MWGDLERLARRVNEEARPEDAQARCSLYIDAKLRRGAAPAAHHERIPSVADKMAAAVGHAGGRHGDAPARAATAMLDAPTLRKLGHVGRTYVRQVNAAPSGETAQALTFDYLFSKLRPAHGDAGRQERTARLIAAMATPRCHLVRHGMAVQLALQAFLAPGTVERELYRRDSELLRSRAEALPAAPAPAPWRAAAL